MVAILESWNQLKIISDYLWKQKYHFQTRYRERIHVSYSMSSYDMYFSF